MSQSTRLAAHAAAAALLLGSFAGAAQAQAQAAPPAFVRVEGMVTAVTDDAMTVTKDGKATRYALSPNWYVVVATPVDIDAIKPGSFVATANMQQPNGEGEALELRVFEPGSKLGEGNRPMGDPGKMMTNATVTRITKGARGRELDVAYPGGVRHIVVPPNIQVIASVRGDRSLVKPGAAIQAAGDPGDGGVVTVSRITVRAPLGPPKF